MCPDRGSLNVLHLDPYMGLVPRTQKDIQEGKSEFLGDARESTAVMRCQVQLKFSYETLPMKQGLHG